jgi:hypothetical protein
MGSYVDVTLYEELDEPAEVSILINGGPPSRMDVIKDEEAGDGHETTWRVYA